jgi:hypothetical protein
MQKVNDKKRHLWSKDMEEALTVQHEAILSQPEALPPTRRTWRVRVRTVVLICAVAALVTLSHRFVTHPIFSLKIDRTPNWDSCKPLKAR